MYLVSRPVTWYSIQYSQGYTALLCLPSLSQYTSVAQAGKVQTRHKDEILSAFSGYRGVTKTPKGGKLGHTAIPDCWTLNIVRSGKPVPTGGGSLNIPHGDL